MEKLMFDNGIKEYEMPGGVLRFNPCDPNVYSRFMAAYEDIQKIEDDLVKNAKGITADGESRGRAILDIMTTSDKLVKEKLSEVFGKDNDFDQLMNGVNIMAVGRNGERIITNLMVALQPIIQVGINEMVNQKADQAAAQAAARREMRGV